MSALQAEQLWQEAFPEKARPELYTSDEPDRDGFRPLADPQDFIANLANLTHLQLYALGENNARALKAAQDEYRQLSRAIAAAKGRDLAIKNPQALQEPSVFEQTKEAALYGYQYQQPKPSLIQNLHPFAKQPDDVTEQEKRDVALFQEPFSQGGFVPTDRQYKAIVRSAKNPKNPDGWKPVQKGGKFYIPVQQKHHDEYTAAYSRRPVDENGAFIRPASVDSEESNLTPSKNELVNKRLTRTRFGGKKHPPTRDASEAPSVASTPSRKRGITPLSDPRPGTPKRPKVNESPADHPAKPKHPNQYTKAREREQAAQHAARAAAGGAISHVPTLPDISSLTTEEKLNRKWTDDELRAAIAADHTWLNPDPAKAAEWRDKILQGVNPVRSWSMVKKWSQWKGEGKDKRPRKKLAASGTVNGGPSGSNTPAPTIETQAQPLDRVVVENAARAAVEPGAGIRSRQSSEGTVYVEESRSRSGTPGGRPTPSRRSTRREPVVKTGGHWRF